MHFLVVFQSYFDAFLPTVMVLLVFQGLINSVACKADMQAYAVLLVQFNTMLLLLFYFCIMVCLI